jgi:hypothetical protein
MARQQVITMTTFMVLLAGCADVEPYDGAFDFPTALGVLQESTIFDEPIGYVASGHSGQISLLALKQGRFLTDDPYVSFLRGAPIATGRDRIITDLGAFQPSDTTIMVVAADMAFGQVITVPHVIDVEDGTPIELDATISEPVFTDADKNGDVATMSDIVVKSGYTSTETWTVTYEVDAWLVHGSRSGDQPLLASTGAPFVGEERDIAFTINGNATSGDYFTVDTDNGLVEYETGGLPTHLSLSPDGAVAAVVVYNSTTEETALRWFDTMEGAFRDADVDLPVESIPASMDWSEDGTRLFVSDEGYPAIWEISPTKTEVVEHIMPFTSSDVTHLSGSTERLYIATASGKEVWTYDLNQGTFQDVNATLEGVQPTTFTSPINGIEAISSSYDFPSFDDSGVQPYGRSVGVSLYDGSVVFIEEESGCLVEDSLGPHTIASTSAANFDYQTSYSGIDFGPYLEQNGSDYNHVVVNGCAGIAVEEDWTLMYNSALGAWEVEGIYSGEQTNLAYEDQRYISDKGEVTFLIRAGGTPTQDGWRITFEVSNGAITANGDNTGSGNRDVLFDMPGDLTFFEYRVGGSDGGWDLIDNRPFLLGFSSTNDVVARIHPQTGYLEVSWQ